MASLLRRVVRPALDPSGPGGSVTFPFLVEPTYTPWARLAGVDPTHAAAVVGPLDLDVRFGPWHVRTPLANVAGAERTGSYRWWRTAGPARLGASDRSLTFATAHEGVTITFREPVGGIDPAHLIRHPSLTVTVVRPDEFVAVLQEASIA